MFVWFKRRVRYVRPAKAIPGFRAKKLRKPTLMRPRSKANAKANELMNAAKASSDERTQAFLRQWREERIRWMAIETGEMENDYKIRDDAKAFLAELGFDHAREHHQLGTERRKRLSTEELQDKLKAEEKSVRMCLECAGREPPSLTLDDMLAMHKTMFGSGWTYGAGRLRQPHESIVIVDEVHGDVTRAVMPWTAKKAMRDFPDHVRNVAGDPNVPTAVAAAHTHSVLAGLHPFCDGNGRMARLMTTYVYAVRGETPPVLAAGSKPIYFQTLKKSFGREGTLNPLAEYLEKASTYGSSQCLQALHDRTPRKRRRAERPTRDDHARSRQTQALVQDIAARTPVRTQDRGATAITR